MRKDAFPDSTTVNRRVASSSARRSTSPQKVLKYVFKRAFSKKIDIFELFMSSIMWFFLLGTLAGIAFLSAAPIAHPDWKVVGKYAPSVKNYLEAEFSGGVSSFWGLRPARIYSAVIDRFPEVSRLYVKRDFLSRTIEVRLTPKIPFAYSDSGAFYTAGGEKFYPSHSLPVNGLLKVASDHTSPEYAIFIAKKLSTRFPSLVSRPLTTKTIGDMVVLNFPEMTISVKRGLPAKVVIGTLQDLSAISGKLKKVDLFSYPRVVFE